MVYFQNSRSILNADLENVLCLRDSPKTFYHFNVKNTYPTLAPKIPALRETLRKEPQILGVAWSGPFGLVESVRDSVQPTEVPFGTPSYGILATG